MAGIRVSEQAFEFAELLQKYHTPAADEHGSAEHDELEAGVTELTRQRPPEPSKAATDYDKWSRIERTIPDEPKKKKGELDLEEPPKEAQVWGCAQDHRKVRRADGRSETYTSAPTRRRCSSSRRPGKPSPRP